VGNDVFWLDRDHALPVDYFAAPIVEDNAVAGAVLVFRDATLRLQYERTLAENQRNLERLVSERTMELQHQIEVRARTEAALRDSRERLKGITDRLFEGVVVVNRGGHLVFANPSARRLLVGDSISGDLEGYPLDEVLRLVAADGTETNFVGSPWQWVAVHGGMMRDDDAVFVVADGRKLAVAYACSPLGGENGSTGAVISFRDMEALKEAQREALQASRMASVGQLAAGIAHEINTPIQYIGDNLRFIRDSFADIATAVAAASDLSAQVAATGQSEAVGAFEHAFESADVPYLVNEIPRAVDQSLEGVAQVARIVLSMKEFSHPGSSEKSMANINRALENTLMVSRNTWKHVADIEEDFDADLPMIPCHAGELNQVFLNLIVNAAQAIEMASRGGKGHIRISTRCEGDSVVVRVSDDGTGIQAAIRDRIFDPFFTTKAVGKGTGQGLAICRDVVVAKHGGRIDVESEDGKGSTFIVRLPLASGDQEARDMLESA
jgi:signal transduction histidine kinase